MGIFSRSDSEAPASGLGASEGASDLSSLREEISEARKPRSDKGKSRGKRGVGVGSDLTQEEVDALFTAENWEALAALPFNTRYVMTGWAGFQLNEKESQRIAQTTATTMKILLKIDPKYIALAVWGTLYFGTWAAKEAQFSSVKAQLAQRRADAKKAAASESSPLGHPNAA